MRVASQLDALYGMAVGTDPMATHLPLPEQSLGQATAAVGVGARVSG